MEAKPGLNWKRILITAIIVLVTAGAVGGTTYYVLNSNFQKEREANEDALANLQEKANKQENNDKSEETTTVRTSTANVIKVSELGIKFTVVKELADLTYSYNAQYSTISVSTRALATTGGATCAASSAPLGTIGVTSQAPLKAGDPNLTPANSEGAFVKQVGNKYIYYMHAQSVCTQTSNPTAEAMQGSYSNFLRASLLNAESI